MANKRVNGGVKETRRGNNEGSIFQRSNGYWKAQITVGVDPATGKQKKRQFSGKTRGEVAKKLTAALNGLQTGTYTEPTLLTLEKWLNDWLTGRKPHIAENTYSGYENAIRCHLSPTLGKIKLKDLKTRDIQTLLNSKLENGRVNGKGGLCPRTVKYIYDTLNTALLQAVKERIIPYNIADAVEIPKQTKREMTTMTGAEIEVFFETVRNYQLNHHHTSPLFAAFYLDLSTGIRRGELLGLHWQEVDFEKKRVMIKTQLLRGKKRLYFSEPKTAKSKRTISINDSTIEILRDHKRRQNELRLSLGESYQDNGLVFCTDEGQPIDPRNFTRHFETLLGKAGLTHYRFHDVRHTFATIGLENGISPKTLQEMLGHSTFKTTMDTYSHVTPAMQKEEAATMETALKVCIKK